MKRLLIILTFLIILSSVQVISAQAEKRIQFAKGKSSATVRGVTGLSGVYYLLMAKSGQKMIVTLTPKTGIGLKIERGTEEVLLEEQKGGTYTVYLEENSEFSIFVGSSSGKSRAYTLTVTITKMKDI